MSPMETELGYLPVAKSIFVAKLIVPKLLVLRNTETELAKLPTLVIAKSGLPLPSKSPIAIEIGFVPVVKSTFAAKLSVPLLPVFRKTETVLLP